MLDLIDEFGSFGEEIDTPTPVDKLPIIAVIGRPNTGKSTIVNKLTNSFKDGSIVHDEPGITRDRTYKTGSWCDYNFQVVDTGGIIFDDTKDIFAERITQQALLALSEATVAVLVCDGKEGLTQLDSIVADWLRKNSKKPLYVALGLGRPWPVSGIHGTGLGDLLDEVTTKHMKKVTNVMKENATNIALIGRSEEHTLFGGERSIVSDVAGTTRDSIDAVISRGAGRYRIIDTAGIRKRGKVDYGAEYFMRIAEEGRACIIALNKWDAVPKKDDNTYIKAVENIRSNLPALRWAERTTRGKALRDISRAARKGEASGLGLQPANRNMMGLMGGGDRSEKKTRGKGF
eukprot:gene25561-34120_t